MYSSFLKMISQSSYPVVLLAVCPVINPRSWDGKGSSGALGEVAEEVIGGLCVSGEEEVASYQLKIILLSNSCMVINPITIPKTFIAPSLSLICHVNLSTLLFIDQSQNIVAPCALGQVKA